MFLKYQLTCLFAMFSLLTTAQSFQVLSTNPANGAAGVNQDSLEIIFNQPILFDAEYPEDYGFNFYLEPEDSLEILGAELKDGGTRLVIQVNLVANVDYLGILASVRAVSGDSLAHPFIMQFTTYPSAGPYTVEGQLTGKELAQLKAKSSHGYYGVIAILGNEPFLTDVSINDSNNDPSGIDENIDFIPYYATAVDTLTGYYSISGVRERTYYPVAFNIFEVENEFEFNFPEIYIYDPNSDFMADSIEVNTSTTVDDTLFSVDLELLSFEPFGFSEALVRAQVGIDALVNDPIIVGGGTQYYLNTYQPKLNTGLQLKLTREKTQSTEDINPFFMYPNGYNLFWEVYIYDEIKDSAGALMVTPFGTFFEGYFSNVDAEVPVEFNTIKPLPPTYIDSDSVMILAESAGGFNFRRGTPQGGFWEVDLSLFHEYWLYPPDPTPSAPVFWNANYYRGYYNEMTFEYSEDSLVIFIDAQTSELLYKEMSTAQEITQDLPKNIQLLQNYPNPFNPTTIIPFEVDQATRVSIGIYNLLGQKVVTLVDKVFTAGHHQIEWNADSYASGIYIYQLKTKDIVQTKNLMLIK